MAAAPNLGAQLETMEEAETSTGKSDEAGCAGIFCGNGGERSERILVCGGNWRC